MLLRLFVDAPHHHSGIFIIGYIVTSDTNVSVFTHAGCYSRRRAKGVRSRLSVCPRCKRKTAWAINTKLGTHIPHGQPLSMHWPRGQKVKCHGHTVTKTVTVARLVVTRDATAVCCGCRRGSACRYDCLCFLVTHACIAAVVGRAFRRVCLSVCLSVCPRSKRKTAWSINTKLSTRILHSSRSACIDPEVKRSKVKVTRYENRYGARYLVTTAGIP